MSRLPRVISSPRWRHTGATAVEYLIALILVSLVVLSAWRLFGETVKQKFRSGEVKVRTMDGTEQEQARADHLEDDNVFQTGGSGSDGSETPQKDKAITVTQGSRKGGLGRPGGSPSLEDDDPQGAQGAQASAGGPSSSGDERQGRGGGSGGSGQKGLQKAGPAGQGAGYAGEEGEEAPVAFNPFTLILLAMVVLGLMILLIKGHREKDKGGGKGEASEGSGVDARLV